MTKDKPDSGKNVKSLSSEKGLLTPKKRYDKKGWANDGKGWKALECEKCHFLNELDKSRCKICGAEL
jgi:hypothetical protein